MLTIVIVIACVLAAIAIAVFIGSLLADWSDDGEINDSHW